MSLLNTLKDFALGRSEQPIPDLGRNARCWCDSGKKYKNCHLDADAKKRSAARASAVRGPSGRGF